MRGARARPLSQLPARCEERGRRDADEATVTRHNSATQNGPIGAASVARGSEAALGGQPHRWRPSWPRNLWARRPRC